MIQKGNFLLLDIEEFRPWLQKQKITRSIDRLQVHHTASPNYTTRQLSNGFAKQDIWKCLEGMRTYHLSQGWSGTGQNITVTESGQIAISLDRDLNKTPAGIAGSNSGAICIEIIGNFDNGGDTMTDNQKQSVIHLYACLAEKLSLSINTDTIVYHAWYAPKTGTRLSDFILGKSSKTCPGTNFWGDGNSIAAAKKNFLPQIQTELNKLKGVNSLSDTKTTTTKIDLITDGKKETVDGLIVGGVSYVPLRKAGDFFGATVGYDANTKTPSLTK
ncbi:N-acetylmuramoyl-L-alanine amidase [Paenibacillus amylolyticus]|uniref:N-acetylmuramoyl-L-alanine amidase n=1 Tax=Paenibacillus amylolyticus TaxID=1451 RepID=UPI000B82FA95|nr:N-acetylmuramoyl-L-alanine amidase [Paenibacillus amylolyticus]